MPKVIIAFDADNSRIGKTVELDEDAARLAVREGRARYASPDTAPTPSAPTDEPPVMTTTGTTSTADAVTTSARKRK